MDSSSNPIRLVKIQWNPLDFMDSNVQVQSEAKNEAQICVDGENSEVIVTVMTVIWKVIKESQFSQNLP